MTVVRRRDSSVKEDLQAAAIRVSPGQVKQMWDDDKLTLEQAVWMTKARKNCGLEP